MVFAAPLNPVFPWGSLAALATVLLVLATLWRLTESYVDAVRRRRVRIALAGVTCCELLLFAAAGFVSYRFAPIAYTVTERAVLIHTRAGEAAVLPLRGLTGAWVDRAGQYGAAYSAYFHINQGGWRLIGPFGLVAENRTSTLETVRVFVTDPKRAVVLDGQPPTIVSPAQPDAFAAAVNARLRELVGARGGRST